MDFKPKSEREIVAELFWPRGVYDFEVVEAEETVSRNGTGSKIGQYQGF